MRTGDELCDAWGDLVFDNKNRGRIYEFFKRNQVKLVQHLEICDICSHFLVQIEPMPTMLANMEHFKSLDPRDFAVFIRELYTNAQTNGLSNDEDEDPIC